MMVNAGHIQGSHQWQTAFFITAALWILLSIVQGWRKGLMRELAGLVAFFAAGYLALNYAGRLSEFLSPHLPALVLFPLPAILIWIFSFSIIALIGRLLFKRTRDCESPLVRLTYGAGGGTIGLGYGLLFLWCILIGLKVVGRIAENQFEIQRAKNESPGSFVLNVAKLKNSIDSGYGRMLLDSIDPLPRRFYRDLDLYSRVIEDREALQKLLEYPGFRQIWESPQIADLRRDPQIVADLQRGDIVGILTNRKVVALLKDPQIRSALSQEELEAALDYALRSRGTAGRR